MLEALQPLAVAHCATVAVVDVDSEPALEAEYGDRVPVLFAGEPGGGTELCHYRFDRARVEAALAGACPVGAARDGIASDAKIR